MNDRPTPIIKGIFVNSHIKALEKARGPEGLKELEKLYGGPINFGAMQDVPVRDEVKVIECILRILHPEIPEEKRHFEGGKLHFNNFITTPLGRIMFGHLAKDFHKMMMSSQYIAGHVFGNVKFTSVDKGPKAVNIVMENADYPLEHFQGFFQAWMDLWDYNGVVKAEIDDQQKYNYIMEWN